MMAACADQALLINGLLDGELDAANVLRIETHLAGCRACSRDYERLQAVRERLAAAGLRQVAPSALSERVSRIGAVGSGRGRLRRGWLVPALGGALAASLALLLVAPQLGYVPTVDRSTEQQLVGNHVRSLLANHLTDVATSNEHVVRPWFNGRIDFAPPVPELAADGFPLIGGRLDYLGGRVVPALVYGRRLHKVNLFVWPAPDAPARQIRRDGYSIEEWSAGGLRFAAVSDIAPGELEGFHRAFAAATG
jgi:anti-sigma factor RsiW